MIALGVILARAGSKGLPGKCLRPLLGRPLIAYTFDHALAASRLDDIVLTTDVAEARKRASERGIMSLERPPHLATDTAPVDAATRDAVIRWEGSRNERIDAAVLLYANIPIRAPDVIDRAVEKLASSGASSVRTVAPVGKHHPDWLHRVDGDRLVQYRLNSIHRRQDLEPLYYHDGAVVAVTRAALFAAEAGTGDPHAFLGSDRRCIVQGPRDALDVDDADDLLLAEALLHVQRVEIA